MILDAPGLTQSGRCVLCGGVDTSEDILRSRMLGLPENFRLRVRRCNECSMTFLAPYLSEAELETLYSESYFSNKKQTGSILAPPPPDAYRDSVRTRLPKFEATLDLLLHLNPQAKSLLDVGAGTGEFVFLARQRGLAAHGIELSQYAIQEAFSRYRIRLQRGTLGKLQPGSKFDIIHLNHVFEHFPDPHTAVDLIGKSLSDGGLVYVEVPYQFNLVDKVKYLLTRRSSFTLHSLHHPVFFNPKTLLDLFRRHGFSCVRMVLFDRVHYPTNDIKGWLKALVWKALSGLGHGLFIEAIFENVRRQ